MSSLLTIMTPQAERKRSSPGSQRTLHGLSLTHPYQGQLKLDVLPARPPKLDLERQTDDWNQSERERKEE